MSDNVVTFPPSTGKADKCGDFFAVDRRAMARACQLGLNPAVSYLILARFTGGDNRTLKAGTNAVEKYTGISRPRAKAAIQDLVDHGLVGTDTDKNVKKITPAHEVKGCENYPPTLTQDQQGLFSRMVKKADENGDVWLPQGRSKEWPTTRPHAEAVALASKGLVRERSNGWVRCTPYDPVKAGEPDWIWLPNAVVTGAADERPPVELIRQCQDVMLLRLFVDLYHAQSLANDGGIHWRQIRKEFSREKIGQRGAMTVWGFQGKNEVAWGTAPFVKPHFTGKVEKKEDGSTRDTGWTDFWNRFSKLTTLGLVEMVGHVIEADTDTAEVIHPYAIDNGDPLERQLAAAAQKAAASLLTSAQVDWALEQGYDLVPVPTHIGDVQLFGIGRLRYRPRTAATAAWYANLYQTCTDFIARYDEMAKGKTGSKSAEFSQ